MLNMTEDIHKKVIHQITMQLDRKIAVLSLT